ncbi:MAG: hypothetical protein AAB385_06420 [Planctomycetota bacterium]
MYEIIALRLTGRGADGCVRRNQRAVGVWKSKNQRGVGGGGDEERVPHVADGEAEFIVPNG